MKIPEPIRDKVEKMVLEKGKVEINGNIIQDTIRLAPEEIGDKKVQKKRKIRICKLKGACSFKNVWTHPDRCYAPFSVFNTCLHKGEERKV